VAARIQFKFKADKLVETILYLARSAMELDQYKVVKLIYLADREHFRRFRRPISFDRFVAMEYGPVASNTLRIMKGEGVAGVDKNALPFEVRKFDKLYFLEHPKRDIKREMFSKSDLKVLDEVIGEYGNCTFGQLYNLTHEHFAYDRAWQNRHSNAEPMRFEDFLDASAEKEEIVEGLEFVAHAI
jgi:uncharacterized phage-associated protein